MIDAKELRIGNWYKQLTTGNYNQVDLFLFHEIYDDENYLDYLTPIPLTTEILEKCGFKYFKDFDTVTKKHVSTCYIKTKKIQISFIYGMTIINANSKNSVEAQIILDYKIEYIHKLQNLYYALTQTELEIKL